MIRLASGSILPTLLIMTIGNQGGMVLPLRAFDPRCRQAVSEEEQIEVSDWLSNIHDELSGGRK